MAFGNTFGNLVLVNGANFIKGCTDAPKFQLRFMRTELKRGAQRIRKSFIKTQLQGAPGIKAGTLAKGKNVFTYVKGDEPKEIYAKIGISRILNVHEQGLTIRAKQGHLLYLHEGKGRGKANSPIVAVVPQVVIPKRLKFREHVKSEAPAVLKKVAQEGARGSEVALTNALKKTIGTL